MTKADRISALRGKTVSITHRAELIDQGSAYPAHVVTPPGRIKWPEGTIVTVDPAPYNKDAGWKPGAVVIHDHAESTAKRWKACMDARVRPGHIVMSGDMSPSIFAERNVNRDYGKMAGTPDPWRDGVGYLGSYDCAGRYRVPYVQMIGRGLRALPGYAQGIKDDRQYQVAPFGKKWRTRVYVRGMWIKTMYSKRRKTAIQKGEAWIGE